MFLRQSLIKTLFQVNIAGKKFIQSLSWKMWLVSVTCISTQFFCCNIQRWLKNYRNSRAEVFLRKDVLKICSKFTGEHPCLSAISTKLQSNFFLRTRLDGYFWNKCINQAFPTQVNQPLFSRLKYFSVLKHLWSYSWKNIIWYGVTFNASTYVIKINCLE